MFTRLCSVDWQRNLSGMPNGGTESHELSVIWEPTENPDAEDRILSAFQFLLDATDSTTRFDKESECSQDEGKVPTKHFPS